LRNDFSHGILNSLEFPIQTFNSARNLTRNVGDIVASELIIRKLVSNIIKGKLRDFHRDIITNKIPKVFKLSKAM